MSLFRQPYEIGRGYEVSVLLLWGKHDYIYPPLQIAYRAEKMLQAQSLVVFEYPGHLTQLEEPDPFNAVRRSFEGISTHAQ
jgi:pimeloyl-ACP methyl ester carboxylesterase